MAKFIGDLQGFFQPIHWYEHYLASQQVTDFALSRNIVFLSFFHYLSYLACPYSHYIRHNISEAYNFWVLSTFLFKQLILDLHNYLFHLFPVDFFLEHLLVNTKNHFKLVLLLRWYFKSNPIRNTIRLFSYIVYHILKGFIVSNSHLINLHYFAIKFGIVLEEFTILKKVYLTIWRRIKVRQLELYLIGSISTNVFRFWLRGNCFSWKPFDYLLKLVFWL